MNGCCVVRTFVVGLRQEIHWAEWGTFQQSGDSEEKYHSGDKGRVNRSKREFARDGHREVVRKYSWKL